MSMEEFGDMRITDDIDRGTEIAMRNNAEHVKRARAAVEPERVADGKGNWTYQRPALPDGAGGWTYVDLTTPGVVFPIPDCVSDDCGIPIPRLRQEMGRIRCVDCQTRKESKRR